MMLDLAAGHWWMTGHAPQGEITISCRMPGDNATALWEAGVIPDPYCEMNEAKVQWIAAVPWTFFTFFQVDEKSEADFYYLSFDSIDTCAELFLNGHRIGRSDNQFIRARYWVGQELRTGENRLEIRIASPLAVAAARAAAYPFDLGQNSNNQVPHLQFLRKTQCHGGWDWGICLPVSGIYGRIELHRVQNARLEYVQTEQEWTPGLESVKLKVRVGINFPADSRTISLVVRFLTQEYKEKFQSSASGEVEREFCFEVKHPRLWHPSGRGEQFLTPLVVSSEEETISQQIGLRSVKLIRKSEDGTGNAFGFQINGKMIFCRGVNWIPADAMPGRMTEARLRHLIADVRDAGMNMIRVWGGGAYESDLFYELCDQFGILIWQDCMFACARYPDSVEFLDSVDRELAWQMRRLNSHPCLVLWCGDNENYACFGHQGSTPEQLRSALLYDRVNRAISTSASRYSNLPWWRSSPDNGEEQLGENPWCANAGDVHYWDVWHGGAPFSDYFKVRPLFCSEFGFQSFPSTATIREWIQREDSNLSSPVMELHQKNPDGNARIISTFARYFRMPENFTETVYLSQVQQAVAVQCAVEFWRSQEPECLGTLIWQLNDNWPVASWSMIDWCGQHKILYYAAKRFYAPLLTTAFPTADGKSALCVVNDQSVSFFGRLEVIFRRFHGAGDYARSYEFTLPAATAKRLDEIADDLQTHDGFWELRMLNEQGEEVAYHDYFPLKYKQYELPAGNISCSIRPEGKGFFVTLESDEFAFFVFAELRRTRCDWSDNAVTLRPGVAVTLFATPERELAAADFEAELSLAHLGAYTCSFKHNLTTRRSIDTHRHSKFNRKVPMNQKSTLFTLGETNEKK